MKKIIQIIRLIQSEGANIYIYSQA